MKKIQEKFLKILKDKNRSKYFSQFLSYFLLSLVLIYCVWLPDDKFDRKGFILFCSLFLLAVTKVLFLKLNLRVIINSYLVLLLLFGMIFRDHVRSFDLLSENPDVIISGLWSMVFFTIISVPWLFVTKICLTEFKNGLIKILLATLIGFISLIITNGAVQQFSRPESNNSYQPN
jgi:hypothetical protein